MYSLQYNTSLVQDVYLNLGAASGLQLSRDLTIFDLI